MSVVILLAYLLWFRCLPSTRADGEKINSYTMLKTDTPKLILSDSYFTMRDGFDFCVELSAKIKGLELYIPKSNNNALRVWDAIIDNEIVDNVWFPVWNAEYIDDELEFQWMNGEKIHPKFWVRVQTSNQQVKYLEPDNSGECFYLTTVVWFGVKVFDLPKPLLADTMCDDMARVICEEPDPSTSAEESLTASEKSTILETAEGQLETLATRVDPTATDRVVSLTVDPSEGVYVTTVGFEESSGESIIVMPSEGIEEFSTIGVQTQNSGDRLRSGIEGTEQVLWETSSQVEETEIWHSVITTIDQLGNSMLTTFEGSDVIGPVSLYDVTETTAVVEATQLPDIGVPGIPDVGQIDSTTPTTTTTTTTTTRTTKTTKDPTNIDSTTEQLTSNNNTNNNSNNNKNNNNNTTTNNNNNTTNNNSNNNNSPKDWNPVPVCACQCTNLTKVHNVSQKDADQLTSSIYQSLSVDVTNTSYAARKRKSARDSRISSRLAGGLGVCVIVTSFALIVAMDAIRLFTH